MMNLLRKLEGEPSWLAIVLVAIATAAFCYYGLG
jgi:hypothetical protein